MSPIDDTYKSPMMIQLYGETNAQSVFERLEDLDPELNQEIQRIAYDHYWSRPGLSLAEKSLITVASLIAPNKEEQIRIHLNGLMNQGLTTAQIDEVQAVSATPNMIASARTLTVRCMELIKISVAVARGDQDESAKVIMAFLGNGGRHEDVKNLLIHQIVYCGFPSSMNGFAALKAATT
jgi:4-carboxymuconolactone decarboxylase